jgi:hypothetical protein
MGQREEFERQIDATWEGTRRRQMLLGAEMTPAERVEWLERRMAELRRLRNAPRFTAGATPREQPRS